MDKAQIINRLKGLSRKELENLGKGSQVGLKVKKDFGVSFWKYVSDDDLLNKISEVIQQKNIDISASLDRKKPTKAKKTLKKRLSTQSSTSLEPIIISLIQPYFIRLEKRIEVLESHLLGKTQSETKKAEFNLEDFPTRLKFHYGKINSEERRGGMVPIPKLWDSLKVEGFSRESFVNGLFELERKRIIELQTASDPKVVREAEKAIDHPSRGLINYVIWRR